jgi:hypothetical protein
MPDKRVNPRFNCCKKGHVEWNGESYPATVTNLSIAGGDMHLCMHFDGMLPGVTFGEECGLCLLDENNPYPCRYIVKVIRVGDSEVIVTLLSMHIPF